MTDTIEQALVPFIEAINWNDPQDQIDVDVWNRLTKNFWLPEKIPMAGDLTTWATLTPHEKLTTTRVFVGLTLLDTWQSVIGADCLKGDARTPQENAVLNNILFMESVHAKSYSNIFSTLCTTEEIREAFRWSRENKFLQAKARLVGEQYVGSHPLKKKIASVFLESFLFYSGFFLPLYWDSRQKLPNTANMIKLIIRDEAVHGYYVGYKFKLAYQELSEAEQAEIKDWTYAFFMELYDNEILYAESMYDELGLTESVKKMMHYNANKAFMNLGFDPLFPAELTDVPAAILAALAPEGAVNHDFFSTQGSTYKIAEVEQTSDADWSGDDLTF